MKSILETSVMSTFNLSDNQKVVLIRTINAHSPEAALSDTATSEKEVAARSTLVDAGMLTMTDSTLEITEDGRELMANEGLTDDMGGLTPSAQELMGDDQLNMNPQSSSEADLPPMESFDLISQINNQIKNQ